MEIDDTGLKTKIESLDFGLSRYFNKWTILVLAVLMFFLAFVSASRGWPTPLFMLTLLVIGIVYTGWEKIAQRKFMTNFAKICGYRFSDTAPIDTINAPYLQMGRDRCINNIVSGVYGNLNIDFFIFNCVLGAGKNSTGIDFTVASIDCAANLPRIFVDARHHSLHDDAVFSYSGLANDKNQGIIKLEGDFNKFFTLWAPKEMEIETLEILEPNIMAGLEEFSKNFSVEFFGNKIYIYARKVIDNGKDLWQLYSLVDFLIDKVVPEAQRACR